MYCVKCGAENPDGSRYCYRCGAELAGGTVPGGESQQPGASQQPGQPQQPGPYQQSPGYYPGVAPTAVPRSTYKSVGIRFVAILIDTIIISVASGIVFAGARRGGVTGGLFPVIYFVYFWLLEGSIGQTVGKKAVGIKVVRTGDFGPIGYGASAIRNLLRIIDGIPGLLYLVGAILVWSTEKRQRLGDLAANTVVISAR